MSLDLSTVLLSQAEQTQLAALDPFIKKEIQERFLLTPEGLEPSKVILSTYKAHDLDKVFLNRFFQFILTKDPQPFNEYCKIYSSGRSADFIGFIKTRSLRNIKLLFEEFVTYKKIPEKTPLSCAWKVFLTSTKLTIFQKTEVLALIIRFLDADKTLKNEAIEKFIKSCEMLKSKYDDELLDSFMQAVGEQNTNITDAFYLLEQFVEKPFDDIFPLACRLIDKSSTLAEIQSHLMRAEIVYEKLWKEADLDSVCQRIMEMPFPINPAIHAKIFLQMREIKRIYETFPQGLDELGLQALIKKLAIEDLDPEAKRLKLVACAILAFKHIFHITLHPTQVFTALAYFHHEIGALAQVKTGEGKSMIVALSALIHASEGHRIHVISSANSLSIRDEEHFKPFFLLFDITSSHICTKVPDKKSFLANIIYGTASDFEFAIMREMIHDEQIFQETRRFLPEKRFDLVLIDEVDNLTIDTTLSSSRIAQPADINYDWIYSPLLKFAQEHKGGKIEELKAFLKIYNEGSIAHLLPTVSEAKLTSWLASSKHALYELNENIDYVVQIKEGQRQIAIIDFSNTGRILEGNRWSKGIHEFLEVKHGIVPKKESYTPLVLSHPVYYSMYKKIIGLSGTLGSREDRGEIEEIYHLTCFDVPTYLSPKRIDKPPVVVPSKAVHIEAIKNSIIEKMSAQRPVLVLCETIEFTQQISNVLKAAGIAHELLNEIQKKSDQEVLALAGQASRVTVATNTAGRGTDIKLSAQSILAGGLHVLLTFYPSSIRVEEQARGRAGRQGQPGSSEVIICSENAIEEHEILRTKRAALQRQLHVNLSRLSLKQFSLAQSFYQRYAKFLRSKADLVALIAPRWIPKRFIKSHAVDLSVFTGKDLILASRGAHLMTLNENDRDSWCIYLDNLHDRVAKLVLDNFAVKTLSVLDFITHDVSRAVFHKIHVPLKILGASEASIRAFMEACFEAACHSMDRIMEEAEAPGNWASVIAGDGSGFEAFLKDMILGRRPKLYDYINFEMET
jgi:SecA DEAD-like domain/SecA preprotein cross-linking domain